MEFKLIDFIEHALNLLILFLLLRHFLYQPVSKFMVNGRRSSRANGSRSTQAETRPMCSRRNMNPR